MKRAATRGGALLIGLAGYGFSMALMIKAGLGLDPWDVFHQGLAGRTGLSFGLITGDRRRRRAARVDPAAQPAWNRNGRQRHRHRGGRRRRAGRSYRRRRPCRYASR